MIYTRIAIFIFLVSLCSSWVNSMFVASAVTLDPGARPGLPFAPDPRWQDGMEGVAGQWNASQQGAGNNDLGYGDVYSGTMMFIRGFADATVTLYWFLASLGLPSAVVLTLTATAYFSYLMAGVYLLTGRNIEAD